MKYIFSVLCVLLVVGCSAKPASVSVAEAAKESISAAYEVMPKECKNESVKKLLTSAQAQIDAVTVACKSEKDVLKKEIANKEFLICVLGALLILFGGLWLIEKLRR